VLAINFFSLIASRRQEYIYISMNKTLTNRVLIIEDDPDSIEPLKIILKINNYTVETALDGESGLAKALQFEPHIVICDISLPGSINGLEVAEALRGNEKTQAVFLVALSGYGRIEDVNEAKAAGFNEYLVKPVIFDELIKTLGSQTVLS
jgi:CheY-like chemotaxis protein